MRMLVSAVCIGVACAAAAREWRISEMPQTDLMDTEVTTNCPIVLDGMGLRNFRFALDFFSTPSNNVQAAFGHDADGDGVLSVGETGLIVGWDCGRWIVTEPDRVTGLSTGEVTSAAAKVFVWDLRLSRKIPRSLTVSENGVPLFPEWVQKPEPWFFDRTWNLVRLTARGVDASSAAFWTEAHEQGTVFILR